MVKNLALGLGGLVALAVLVVLGLAATKPDTFRMQRSVTVHAKPETIYALVSDFHAWTRWSPYEKLDPGMTRTYTGATSGLGSVYEWSGNEKAGQGRMEIVDASAPTKLTIKLDFLKPFEGHNVTEFALAPQGGDTTVTWSMHGPSPFFHKVISVFCSMDKMLGPDYEMGLATLKGLAER